VVLITLAGLNNMGKKIEIIPKGKQGIPVDNPFTFIVKIAEYPPVFPEQTMNIPYIIVGVAV